MKHFEEKKNTYISGPNLIQKGFMVPIRAFSHVLCIGKSKCYILSKLAGSRNSPSLWHSGRWVVRQWQMNVYWMDSAGDLKRDCLQLGKRVMLTLVRAKTYYFVVASCKRWVYESCKICWIFHACNFVIVYSF